MKSVLITGCSSGFGLKTAVTLARNGFQVFASMRRLEKRDALDRALAAAGATAEVLALDVTDAASISAAVQTVLARAGRIDALINNAGFGVGGFVEDVSLADYRRQLETNFFGVVAVTKAVLPQMRAQRAGRILNMSSMFGRVSNVALSAYNASKFAVEGFSESLAFEARGFGVQVVLIEPGIFKTEIFESNRELAAGAQNPASPYADITPVLEHRLNGMVARYGGDSQRVADLILKVLTTPRPRLRYLVGSDAKIMVTLHRFGGFRLYAALFRSILGLTPLQTKLRNPIAANVGSA